MNQFILKISPENEKTDQRSGRWRIFKMVGVVGIEPTTFCSQSRRAEPLRYTPLSLAILYNNSGFHNSQSGEPGIHAFFAIFNR